MDEIRDAPEELVMQMREIAQIDNIEEHLLAVGWLEWVQSNRPTGEIR